VLARASSSPGLDAVRFYELALFCFLTGNADMHLKNFSILYRENGLVGLAPACDLLATSLLMPADKEEMALTLNGKKRKLKPGDFIFLAHSLSLTEKQIKNVHDRFQATHEQVEPLIAQSFTSPERQEQYLELFRERWQRLGF
jgi:serine/threonine-protein kinase HipA